ncbi:MAG: GIY-YIG nuclease family protein [Chromatiaceae bacterium]|jgi:putative endonuclease|nr:GIY-YIG nuclease family protein [Chromatiaceae bacterium]
MWYLYLVRCNDGSLYTGISKDVARRFEAHRSNRGARRLRGRGPLELVYSHPLGDRSLALRVEHRVKKLCRADKEKLLRGEAQLPI